MKKLFFLLGFIFFSIGGNSQEFSASEGFFIGRQEVRPSLSLLTTELPETKMTLTEIDWRREKKREVNFVAMMELERHEKEKGKVELDAPMPTLSKGEKSLIEVTNDIRIHDRSSNYDIYTGQKKIPAYEEMRVPLFSSPYHSRSRVRGYVSPYSYSPFLR